MIDIHKIRQSDISDVDEVMEQLEEAKRYLNSFRWCKRIVGGALAQNFGYILCIFLFDIEPTEGSGADEKLWVIVGDLPPAYLDIVDYKTPYEALDFYCFLMDEWVDCVGNGVSVDNCYPVNAEPTLENAKMLHTRINLIKSDFLPFCVNS